ncbi:hypothetical protein RRG08_047519 [Elysia crispata]|uniref:Uncharacterized protein n=1 Tax=Elysia crispata TaxID=231223 RepID=A0AAE1CNQ3_9GAST|nr:hypothetical protein RRG08_047519 [Elysia crispata]
MPALTVICLLHTVLIASGTKFLVTLPKQPHYDSEVLATVTAVNVPPQGDNVTLTYRGARDTSRILNKTELEFKKDGVQTWGVVFPWKRMQNLKETGVKFDIGNVDERLYFLPDPGYIFIQTDKPIYTPRQTVRFRIIAVDYNQTLTKYQLKVDIKNPENIIVDRMRYSAEEAFTGQAFELPREATEGIWSISANFEGLDTKFSATKTVEFEVSEYVLPRFSADLKIDTDVITRDTDWVSFNISGAYVYGRPLQGKAEMQLGVWDPDNGVQLLPHWCREELKNGKARCYFKMTEVFPDQEFLDYSLLYVSLNVTEAGTGENDTIVDTSVVLSHPYYEIDFSAADQYFKPGFPYTMKMEITSKSGLPGSSVDLKGFVDFKDKDDQKIDTVNILGQSDGEGRFVQIFELSNETDKIEITVGALDWKRLDYTPSKYSPIKQKTLTNQYIQVSVPETDEDSRKRKVELLYTADPFSTTKDTKITVQVLSKGQVIYTTTTIKNRDGRSTLELPSELYPEASPSMRVLAYYYATLGKLSEFVVDSLLVDTKDTCLEEIYIEPIGDGYSFQVYKPKGKYEMELFGERNTRIGLVAVDEAVFLLKDKQTLTRKSLFQDMESLDQGMGEGDGESLESILFNSGQKHLIFDTESYSEPYGRARVPLFDMPVLQEMNFYKQASKRNVAPPQTVRKYFPESWLFEEFKLNNTDYKRLNLILPDSITTWNIMAVSLSPHRGVCVSEPLRAVVQKLFFADVRLPYKVTRLEEVKVKIAIYNYRLRSNEIQGVVSGVDGICFSANSLSGHTVEDHTFTVNVPPKDIVTEVVKIIPLKNGELTLRVDLQETRGKKERDVVEKKIFVVAEGRRVHKSITFVLDPEARQMSYNDSQEDKIIVKSSPTVNNTFDTKKKEQSTTIDLALPEEAIMGTESCRIAAFGDLMGDIITHAVVESKSLVDQPMADAEEVLGDLGPTVQALLYINESGLANEELAEKGRRFIRHSVVRLLKYRDGDFFKLTPRSKPATWLTAAVLKTLCYASKLTFLDKESLIDKGFSWLVEQVNYQGGNILELDWRLSQDSLEYKVMLSAEVLIAVLECERLQFEDHLIFMSGMVTYLEDHLHMIQQPMVLAKAVYALDLFEEGSEVSNKGVEKLWRMKRKNELDQHYWAEKDDDDDSGSVPFWYQLGAKASSIEATSYALLVFLQRRGQMEHIDSIADWLVGQRNENGAFVGAMDSMVAIQALSRYSLVKRQEDLLKIDLSCNVSSERFTDRQSHYFRFTEQDATSPKSVDNVPVGHKLEVLTKGKGLGQMHVNVEYNIPLDTNANCYFNISAKATFIKIHNTEEMQSNPVCHSCGIGCHDESPNKKSETKMDAPVRDRDLDRHPDTRRNRRSSNGKPVLNDPLRSHPPPSLETQRNNKRRVTKASKYPPTTPTSANRLRTFDQFSPYTPSARQISPPSRKLPSSTTSYRSTIDSTQAGQNQRHRSRRSYTTASKLSICIHVCLRYLQEGSSGRTSIEVEMLTGYLPVMSDLDQIENQPNVRIVQFLDERDILVVQFDKIPSGTDTCFALRATDEQEVGKPTPASVILKEAGLSQPSCALGYDPPQGEKSLQVFCADFFNKHRGECKCISGKCSSCLPEPGSKANMHLSTLIPMACEADVAYELKLTNVKYKNKWVEIDATVIHANKSGSHAVQPNETITLMTPRVCICPHFYFPPGGETEDMMYMLSTDVETLVDRSGQTVYRYLLNEKSKILRVSHSANETLESSSPAASYYDLGTAFLRCN